VSWKVISSALTEVPLRAYRGKKNILATCSSLFQILLRRGPAAIKRRIETRKTLRRLTAASVQLQSNPEQIVVAAVVGGVVGDNIIAARFFRDLGAACPNVRLDIYTSNVALGEWIYSGVPGKRNCFQDSVFGKLPVNYDAEIEFGDTVRFVGAKPSILSNEHDPLSKIITSISNFSKLREKNTTAYNPDGLIAQELLYTHGTNRSRANHLIAGIPYGGHRYELAADEAVIAKLSLSDKRYVTVHNGFDLSQITQSGTASKVYPRFADVIEQVRKVMPDLVFVQIGSSTSVAIRGTDMNLIGKTSLFEAAALVRGATCHLDNEGGLVTIASCYGTPCCVVFGPSSADYFSYEGNVAIRPVECGGCWWIAKDWMGRCPRGMSEPVCMYSQPPSNVAEGMLQLLRR
jgi:hypothetical protein